MCTEIYQGELGCTLSCTMIKGEKNNLRAVSVLGTYCIVPYYTDVTDPYLIELECTSMVLRIEIVGLGTHTKERQLKINSTKQNGYGRR